MEDQPASAATWQGSGIGDAPTLWPVKYWPCVHGESKFLNAQQYWHVADQISEMAREVEPCRCSTVDIAKIGDFWELKDKGGPLGKINLRVFFFVNTDLHEIVILGVHKKEDENQLRTSVITRISRRLRLYLQGTSPNK